MPDLAYCNTTIHLQSYSKIQQHYYYNAVQYYNTLTQWCSGISISHLSTSHAAEMLLYFNVSLSVMENVLSIESSPRSWSTRFTTIVASGPPCLT